MSKPLVSICIPTYNNARFLPQCLDSIVSQTYDNMEVIIADDGSTDNTYSIISQYVKRYGFIYHRNQINMGAARTSSRLVELSKGDYIAIYHSDDVYDKSIVEESVALLNSDQNIGLVSTMSNIVDNLGNPIGEFRFHDALKNLNKTKYDFDDTMLGVLKNGGNDIFIVTPSVMARRSAYDELGLFEANKYRSAYDYEMWFRIATKYHVAIIDKKLMSYRIHQNQISEKQIRKNTDVQNIVWVIRDYVKFIKSMRLRRFCGNLINKWIFRTAKKQNHYGFFEKSNETLDHIRSMKYLPLKLILMIFNLFKISLIKINIQTRI